MCLTQAMGGWLPHPTLPEGSDSKGPGKAVEAVDRKPSCFPFANSAPGSHFLPSGTWGGRGRAEYGSLSPFTLTQSWKEVKCRSQGEVLEDSSQEGTDASASPVTARGSTLVQHLQFIHAPWLSHPRQDAVDASSSSMALWGLLGEDSPTAPGIAWRPFAN